MSFVTLVTGFVSLLLFALTYIISTTPYTPMWLGLITGALALLLSFLTFLSWIADRGEKLEDFTNGR